MKIKTIQGLGFLPFVLLLMGGCQTLFGWDIHAPGRLSNNFFTSIETIDAGVGLWLSPEVYQYVSKDRGSRFADPQTYHVGESLSPMILEGFQHSFKRFYLLEVEPTPEMMQAYGLEYLVGVGVKDFNNHVTMKGQGVGLVLRAEIYNAKLESLVNLDVQGSSEAVKVFAKKGGPEVNLNAAIENATSSLILYLQDAIREQSW